MAKGAAGAEVQRAREASRIVRSAEKAKPSSNLSADDAANILNRGDSQGKDRSRLVDLANADQRRKYKRWDTFAQYREAKLQRGTIHKVNRNEPGTKKPAESDDSKRIYDEPDLDPLIRQTSDEISSQTNLSADVQAAFASNDPLTINQTWFNTRNRISAQTWGEFVNKYPEKTTAYAQKHQGIRAALEEIQRQEQAQLSQLQTQARERVQAEGDQLLADSVRREMNDVSEKMVREELLVSESEPGDVKGGETIEAGSETKLLSMETAGTQATLLLNGEVGAEIDRVKIEAIAKGEKPNTEKANKASQSERQEYWNGENSPFKGMTFEQQLEKWHGTMQEFFDQYKGKPEAEFFKRIGIDVENENAVAEIHKTYFVDGKGDLGLFAQKIAQNNTAEQIQENKAVIQYLGKMYGEKSAKVVVEMTNGIKNAQADVDSFIQSAQAGIDKGDDMPGIDLVNLLNANKENPNDTGSMQTSSAEEDVTNSSDLTGAENTSEAIATDHNDQEFKLNWDKRASSTDTWSGGGDLKIEGDVLAFTPQVNKLRNPYSPGTTEYDYFEKYQVRYFQPDNPSDYFIGEQRKRVERGVELAVDSKAGKVPSSMFWKIIESDPESVGSGPFGRNVTLDTQSDSVKSVRPVDLKIRNDEGTPRTVDVNFSWKGLKVDRQTLVGMQQKALEYLNQQVDAGIMPAETLDTAISLVSRYKAPRTVSRPREIPLVSKFQTPEKWRSDGSLVVSDKDIVYSDAKLREIRGSRSIEIFTADPNNPSKRILTAQAWDVLNAATNGVDGNRPVTDALTQEVMKRGGEFYRPVITFTADRPMISEMKGLIRDNVAREIQEGAMDESVLSDIDNVLNYKNPAAEPNNITTEAVQDTASKAA